MTGFLPAIDSLYTELDKRASAYKMDGRYGFLRRLPTSTPDEIRVAASRLVAKYPADIDDCLGDELCQFMELAKEMGNDSPNEASMYATIV